MEAVFLILRHVSRNIVQMVRLFAQMVLVRQIKQRVLILWDVKETSSNALMEIALTKRMTLKLEKLEKPALLTLVLKKLHTNA